MILLKVTFPAQRFCTYAASALGSTFLGALVPFRQRVVVRNEDLRPRGVPCYRLDLASRAGRDGRVSTRT